MQRKSQAVPLTPVPPSWAERVAAVVFLVIVAVVFVGGLAFWSAHFGLGVFGGA